MTILVINSGSSSLKFKVFKEDTCVLSGSVKEIGSDHSTVHFVNNKGKEVHENKAMPTHDDATQWLVDLLLKEDLHHINAVGHRVVHGGALFVKPIKLSTAIVQRLELLNHLAPLHNPANVEGIRRFMILFDNVPHIAIFDTAFHSSIPEHITTVPIPEEFRHDGIVRKYGFHGTSHQYVYQQIVSLQELHEKVISCHIGNGVSVCAMHNGKSLNTSMGFTPLTGPVMGTRTGDIDFGIASFLHEHDGLSMEEIDSLFNHQGGLIGLCGVSDIKHIHEHQESNPKFSLALTRLESDIARIIAGYTADLGGVQTLAFTGGAGEAAPWLRSAICKKLEHLGVHLDEKKNKSVTFGSIHTEHAKVHCVVVPTDEEKMISVLVRQILASEKQ